MATRDNETFLGRTISGILEKTRFAQLDLVIVDNGSTDPRALSLLQSAAKDERVTLLRAPGPFNFAALNNLGAAEARGAVIVFLNNDMEIIEPDWLRELAERAIDPHVGAVGCKLLYPDGRIQHAGVVVGFGEGVGHFDAGLRDGEKSWLGRNGILHEASAVTGACLAVERAKFVAVGGFDAVHLPVEFNDIDLCLRLEELGFATLWTPFARRCSFRIGKPRQGDVPASRHARRRARLLPPTLGRSAARRSFLSSRSLARQFIGGPRLKASLRRSDSLPGLQKGRYLAPWSQGHSPGGNSRPIERR